jgi:hypothetical protein
MKQNTFIKHKEAIVVCEENEPINLSYNALLTTLKVNTLVILVIHVATTKSTSSCTDCGKTYHNQKKKVPIVPTTIVKSTKPRAETKT